MVYVREIIPIGGRKIQVVWNMNFMTFHSVGNMKPPTSIYIYIYSISMCPVIKGICFYVLVDIAMEDGLIFGG